MQIFRTDDEKLMFIKKADGLKCLVDMLQEREPRLHENTLGAILALMENPEVPDMLLDEADLDVVPKLVRMIGAANLVVRKLTFGILKCLSIYDTVSVHAKIPLQVSERSERSLMKTRILAMNPAKWLQTATSANKLNKHYST